MCPGVMRFLQTEWHRHERDRNAWEIERQEMKARVASLEGSGRRSDSQQTSLKKYIKMLEGVLAQERKKAKALKEGAEPEKENHAVKKDTRRKLPGGIANQPELKPIVAAAAARAQSSLLNMNEGDLDVEDVEVPDKSNLVGFLGQCTGEFTYLLVSPSNPQPPPESPQHQPSMQFEEDLRLPGQSQQALEEIYLQPAIQKMQRDVRAQPPPNHQIPPAPVMNSIPIRNHEVQAAPMVRSIAEQPQLNQAPQEITQVTHSFDSYGRSADTSDGSGEKESPVEAAGWEFPDPEPKPTTSRPDTDLFPIAQDLPTSPNRGASHRRKGSMSRRRSIDKELLIGATQQKADGSFKVKFGLRGHLDAVRTVIFTGGGSPGEPEICTAGDDGVIKRWIIPARFDGNSMSTDLDVQSYFTHRGHSGSVMCLTSYFPSANFASGGRAQGDGWVFSGGQDASVRVWERGRVDPKATLDGHTDAVWSVCVLPTTCGAVFGPNSPYGGADRLLLASGSADGSVKVWSVSAPPMLMSPQVQGGSGRRGTGRVRGNSMSSGSGFPSSPQPSMASNSPFNYTLIHTIRRANSDASPTCITPLSPTGDNFVVSYSDAAVLVYDTRTGEEMAAMASLETYNGTIETGVNAVVATTTGLDGSLSFDSGRGLSEDDSIVHGATGSSGGIEGIIISGHEDRYIRFYDANSGKWQPNSPDRTTTKPVSGQCTYNMLAHPAAISALSLSPDGHELVSAGHDASLRFWSLEKRSCTQEITSHRLMRGEGVCAVVWSQDGRFVVSGGGDGVVKVFAR